MATIYHQVWINADAARVYAAMATADAIGQWWDKQTSVKTARGEVLQHDPGAEHGVVKLLVVEQIAGKFIEWECVSTHPASSPASAWTGTHFLFEVSAQAAPSWVCPAEGVTQMTVLDFRQTNYDEQSKFYGFNNFAWGQVLQNLKRVVEKR